MSVQPERAFEIGERVRRTVSAEYGTVTDLSGGLVFVIADHVASVTAWPADEIESVEDHWFSLLCDRCREIIARVSPPLPVVAVVCSGCREVTA